VEGKDNIKDLFNEKLSGFEGNVRPELWSSILSQIATPVATSVGTGISLLTKTVIGLSVAASIGVVGFYLFTRSEENKNYKSSVSNKEITEDNKIKALSNETSTTSNSNGTAEKGSDVILTMESNQPVENGSDLDKTEENKADVISNKQVENNQRVDNKPYIKEDKIVDLEAPINKEVGIQETTNTDGTVLTQEEEVKETESSVGELPNVFTPNGDGVNDYLSVKTDQATDFSVVILDQNNKIVYQSTDAAFNWNGTSMAGDHVPNGSYVYYVTARNSKGELITKHSRLTINR
jgi:gliding motility-associated-like protein